MFYFNDLFPLTKHNKTFFDTLSLAFNLVRDDSLYVACKPLRDNNYAVVVLLENGKLYVTLRRGVSWGHVAVDIDEWEACNPSIIEFLGDAGKGKYYEVTLDSADGPRLSHYTPDEA